MKYGILLPVKGAFTAITFILSLIACTSEEEIVIKPIVVSGNVDISSIGFGEATVEASIPTAGTRKITEYGIEYSTTPETFGRMKVGGIPQDTSFRVEITNLDHGTTYYYRAYISTDDVYNTYRYGEIKSFQTLSPKISYVSKSKAWVGDTILVTGTFFTDTSKTSISLLNPYEYKTVSKSDVLKFNQDSIMFIIPSLFGDHPMTIVYRKIYSIDETHHTRENAAFAEYGALEIAKPRIANIYPEVLHANDSLLILDVDNLNPVLSRNKFQVPGYGESDMRIVILDGDHDQVRILFNRRKPCNCDRRIAISNGGHLYSDDDLTKLFYDSRSMR